MQSLDLDVLQNALDWREAGHRFWLVTVTETFGASPRPPGSTSFAAESDLNASAFSWPNLHLSPTPGNMPCRTTQPYP